MSGEEREYYDPGYCGSDNWWQHPLFKLIYVDSVRDFCNEYAAWWTLDVVGSYMRQFKDYDFLVLTFDVDGNSAVFTAREDSGREPVVTQRIAFTDLKVSVRLYLEQGVLIFPSDH